MTAVLDQQQTAARFGTAVAGAIGAAIGQRKMLDDGAQRAYSGDVLQRLPDPSTVTNRLDDWISERRAAQMKTAAPAVIGAATQGRNIALAGGAGGLRAGWVPGIGARELSKHTRAAIANGDPGFSGESGAVVSRLLRLLTLA